MVKTAATEGLGQCLIDNMCSSFQLNAVLYRRAVGQIDDTLARQQISGRANPLLWIAGHMGYSREQLASALGGGPSGATWSHQFARGQQEVVALQENVESVRREWEKCSDALAKRLRALKHAALMQHVPPSVVSWDGTILGACVAYLFHDSYHLGQLGLIYKVLTGVSISEAAPRLLKEERK